MLSRPLQGFILALPPASIDPAAAAAPSLSGQSWACSSRSTRNRDQSWAGWLLNRGRKWASNAGAAALGSASSFSRLTHGRIPNPRLPGAPDASRTTGTEAGDTRPTSALWMGFSGACRLLIFWKYMCTRALSICAASNDLHFLDFFFSYFIYSLLQHFIPSDELLSQIFISGSVFRGTRKCHLYLSLSSPTVLVFFFNTFP